jgi:hypothetical protein
LSLILTVLEVNIGAKVHLRRDRLEDETALATRRVGELDLAVKTTGTEESRVERVLTVGRHDDLWC